MPFEKDALIEQQIFLGGQISNKHPIFQDIARMSADYAEVYQLLKKMSEWETEQDEAKVLNELVELLGEIDFVRNCTELTRLSMIMGDTRGKYNLRKGIDELRQTGSNPQP